MPCHIITCVGLFWIGLFPLCGYTQSWSAMGTGLYVGSGAGIELNSIVSYQDKIHCAGSFAISPSINSLCIAKWNNFEWDSLGTGVTSVYIIKSLCEYKNELYVGGVFSSAGGISGTRRIARWDGTQWKSVGGGVTTTSPTAGDVKALKVYKGELYAAGVSTEVGGVSVPGFAKWNGSVWSPVPMALGGWPIETMEVFQGELYIGGGFTSVDNQPCNGLIKWNGTNWSYVGGSAFPVNGDVHELKADTINNILYVSGYFTAVGGGLKGSYTYDGIPAKGIATWNGSCWSSMPNNPVNYPGFALEMYNGFLYASTYGNWPTIENDVLLQRWDGTQWENFIDTLDNGISAMKAWNDTLYVGGGFRTINGDTMNYVAQYYDTTRARPDSICLVEASIDTFALYQDTIQFYGISTTTCSWYWDFGDGTKDSLSQVPHHLYANNGSYTVTLISSDGFCADTAYYTIDIATGVPSRRPAGSSVTEFKMFPNPAGNSVRIETEKGDEIVITDLQGRKVVSVPVKGRVTKLDTSQLEEGVYIVSLQDGNKLIGSERLVIER